MEEINLEEMGKAIETDLNLNIDQEITDAPDAELTPLGIFAFKEITDGGSPGTIQQPTEEELDEERAQSDALALRAVYDEVVQQVNVSSVQESCVAVATVVWGEWEEDMQALATILQTYENFEAMELNDALGAMALAQQSKFIYGGGKGLVAAFDFSDALAFSLAKIEMKYRHKKTTAPPVKAAQSALIAAMYPAILYIEIPMWTDHAPAIFCPYLIDVLKISGEKILAYLS
jgi:hypothetical protein